ncbi:MAG TPA: proton-conducting transporter membrane subunit [Candidatus Limiplasma sp.]|nr:proton-conducting transporter membrane subunit [Candidatus Limiplasma sp.]
MQLVQNVPFFGIMLSMIAAVVSPMLNRRAAKWLSVGLAGAVICLHIWFVQFMIGFGGSYTYMMGHYPAPWGNELRAGLLEAVIALALSVVMLLSQLSGMNKLQRQIDPQKQVFFYVMCDLVMAGMLALVYTNDLFTAYVFIEILALSSCALMMARQVGHTMVASMRYMILSLLGSGLILIAIALTYNLTGHLLMENIHEVVARYAQDGEYALPISVIIGLFIAGIGIKCGLFPFHMWLPDAYGYSTSAASAVLSSVVSKAYFFLLVKIFYRVIGMDVIESDMALNLLLALGVSSMILGSIGAIRCLDIRRMVAFSSVSQMGYLFAWLGLGSTIGVAAALFHMVVHALCKSMLFLSVSPLSDASGDSKRFVNLRGAGYRYVIPGIAFTLGALSMVGIPILGGFFSKIFFAEAALYAAHTTRIVLLAALALSTLLNAFYFMHTVMTLYRKPKDSFVRQPFQKSRLTTVTLGVFGVINVAIGFFAKDIVNFITTGLLNFA